MSNTIRIKRRPSGGGAGSPSTMQNAELAYNEQTDILYYGTGTGGAGGTATAALPIGGKGAVVDLVTNQTVAGVKTFSSPISASITGNAGTASALATPRSLSLTGDGTASIASFDGSANVTTGFTLATVNANLGTFTKITTNAKGQVTAASQASLSDLSAPTGDISNGGFKITNVAAPLAATDAATKNYVDSVAQGLAVKAPVLAATTANITLSGAQTIDGISVAVGDRVLVKDQTTAATNGIYVVAAGSWTRSVDADVWTELVSAFTFVETGTANADKGFVCTSDPGGTLGTTSVVFAQFSGAGGSTYTAGTGLTLASGVFSITPSAVTAGAYGAASQTLVATVNAQGQLTALGAVDIALDGGTY